MSDMKWTPGPWRINRHAGAYIESREHGIANAACWHTNKYDTGPEQEANAHLIAAAPELYEALQAAVDRDAFDELGNDAPWLEKAIAALAKARGES